MTSTKPSMMSKGIYICDVCGQLETQYAINEFGSSCTQNLSHTGPGCPGKLLRQISVSAVIEMIETRLQSYQNEMKRPMDFTLEEMSEAIGRCNELESLKKQIEGE